jgi:hypothetical protein
MWLVCCGFWLPHSVKVVCAKLRGAVNTCQSMTPARVLGSTCFEGRPHLHLQEAQSSITKRVSGLEATLGAGVGGSVAVSSSTAGASSAPGRVGASLHSAQE